MKYLPLPAQEKLQALGVTAVVLFGSHVQGLADEKSDYDIGLLLNKTGFQKRAKNFPEYYTSLYDILVDHFSDRNGLDIVFLDRAPLELRRHVSFYGQTVMEQEIGLVTDFNAQTVLLYADFEPYRIFFNEAILSHI